MNWPVQKKEVIPIIQTSVFLHFAQKIGKVSKQRGAGKDNASWVLLVFCKGDVFELKVLNDSFVFWPTGLKIESGIYRPGQPNWDF